MDAPTVTEQTRECTASSALMVDQRSAHRYGVTVGDHRTSDPLRHPSDPNFTRFSQPTKSDHVVECEDPNNPGT